jgi:hypothetical protein
VKRARIRELIAAWMTDMRHSWDVLIMHRQRANLEKLAERWCDISTTHNSSTIWS